MLDVHLAVGRLELDGDGPQQRLVLEGARGGHEEREAQVGGRRIARQQLVQLLRIAPVGRLSIEIGIICFFFCWTEKPVDNGRAIALRSAEKEVQYVKWKVPKNETNEMVHI